MDHATARRRVAGARVGHLATVTAAGRPHLVPCCFVLEGDSIFTAVDAKPKSTLALRRLDNISAHPAVSLLVDHYEEDWDTLWWVRVDAAAEICRVPARRALALDALAAKYAPYRRSPPPGPVVELAVTAWRWWP